MFKSIEDVQKKLDKIGYLCSTKIATVVFLSRKLQKPLLVEGPAGVGKTELAKAIAASEKLELIRLQCYEGLDESKALYEWEYAKQLLYTQMLKEKIGEILKSSENISDAVEQIAGQDDAFFSSRFILPRPLLQAIQSEDLCVLLIDEVDKSDPEFEAFLLEVLSDFQISVPELGVIKAKHIPQVVLTSNDSREMSDALKRRCLYLHLDFPDSEMEARIVKRKVPGIKERTIGQVIRVINALREMDLKKQPSISETLDWAKALTLMNAEDLNSDLIKSTMNTVIKYQSDMDKVMDSMSVLTRQARETNQN